MGISREHSTTGSETLRTTPQSDQTAKQEGEFDTRMLALALAEAADERKALAIRILDVRGIVSYTDFIVVCHGTSTTHARAIADHVEQDLRPLKIRPRAVEGARQAEWILLDYIDAVMHVFNEPLRAEYAIESIYSDAPRVPFESENADAMPQAPTTADDED